MFSRAVLAQCIHRWITTKTIAALISFSVNSYTTGDEEGKT